MTPNQHQTHIPIIIQEATKMVDIMLGNQARTDFEIQLMHFPIEPSVRHQLFKAADDINSSLRTIRFLVLTKVIEKHDGYNIRDGIPREPESKMPENMNIELVTDPLVHEPIGYPLWPDRNDLLDKETANLNEALERTSYTYTKIHEFNRKTEEYSTSDKTQCCFDAAMNCAFMRLKMQYHILLEARDTIEFDL